MTAKSTKRRLLSRNAPSRLSGGVDPAGRPQAVPAPGDQAHAGHHHDAEEAQEQPPMSESEKAWTDSITPDRVRKVPRMVRLKVEMTSERFQTRSSPRRSWTITEWR